MQAGPLVVGKFLRDQVQQDFCIGFEGQMQLRIGEDLAAKLRIVGQLAVEGKAEPLQFFDVPPLERLGVAAPFFAAGRIAHVTDGGRPGALVHDRFKFCPVVEPKDFAHGADAFPFHEQFVAVRMEGRQAGRQLAPVLHIHKHSRDQPGGRAGRMSRQETAGPLVGEMVDGCQAALVMEIGHQLSFWKRFRDRCGGLRATRTESRRIAGSGRHPVTPGLRWGPAA